MDTNYLNRLKIDFPELCFRKGRKFAFRPPKTVIIGPEEPHSKLLMLHEIAHAILGHRDFALDIERLKMENEAWEKAKELALYYEVLVDEEKIQDELDTYRDWLHKKSRCPLCKLTRFQDINGYHCPRCEAFKIQIK